MNASSTSVIQRDSRTDSYWIFGGLLLATLLHRISYDLLSRYCADFSRFRLSRAHFADLSLKVARVVYFTQIGLVVFTTLLGRMLSTSARSFPDSFFDDVDRWSGAALFALTFDIYELGHLRGLAGQGVRIAHHLLELTITWLWVAFEPSPMLVFAGAYVVVANMAFLFPVLMRLRPYSQAMQQAFAMTSISIIMVGVLITDVCIACYLILFWNQTSLLRRLTAIVFTLGFTALDGALCRAYFYPLIRKARSGDLYSPPAKIDSFMQETDKQPTSTMSKRVVVAVHDDHLPPTGSASVIKLTPMEEEISLSMKKEYRHGDNAALRHGAGHPTLTSFDLPTETNPTVFSNESLVFSDESTINSTCVKGDDGKVGGGEFSKTMKFAGLTVFNMSDFVDSDSTKMAKENDAYCDTK